jgi:Ca2+-dependent lipid-binding protein
LKNSDKSTKVELVISCKDLRNADTFSKSDPFVVMFTADGSGWREFGRTETIDDNLNPEFAKKFTINYRFETQQKLKFEVYDSDSSSSDLSEHDFLGRSLTTLGEIVGASSGDFTRNLFRDE